MDNLKISNKEEVLQIFEDLEKKAKDINPNLLYEIESFNQNHVTLESYHNFISALNQPPVLTSSNHVSQ